MVLTKYPIGLHAKTKFFRCCSTTWNQETRDWILSRMKANTHNIKPIFVFNPDDTVTMFLPDIDLTTFTETTPQNEYLIYAAQNKRKAEWMRRRTAIQKDDTKTPEEKERDIEALDDIKHGKKEILKNQKFKVNKPSG